MTKLNVFILLVFLLLGGSAFAQDDDSGGIPGAQTSAVPDVPVQGPPASLANPAAAAPTSCTMNQNGYLVNVPCPTSAIKAAAAASNGGGALNLQSLQANYSDCYQAYVNAMAECNSGGGTGSKIAAGINGAATVINIQQSQSPAQVNSACKSAEDSAIANGLGNGVIAYACQNANSTCNDVCGNYAAAAPLAAAAGCQATFKNFEMMGAAQLVTTMAQVALAGRCGSQTNPNAPVIPGGPAYQGPQFQEPANAGLQPLPPGSPVAPCATCATDGMAASGLPGGAPYPGGAPDKAQAKNPDSGITDPALGLSGGSGGGGWPTSAGAKGGAAGGAPPIDLSALLPKAGDPSRAPASLSEITGANDLTNFQKVTRMMNKKRPVLKSGEGA